MTLTVRLDMAIESALDRYCIERGVSKSLVVQESLASYLLNDASAKAQAAARVKTESTVPVSANFKAFAALGLVGGVADGRGADKSAVRARMAERAIQKKTR